MFPSLIAPETISDETEWWTIFQMSLNSDSLLFAMKDINLKSFGSALHTANEAMYILKFSMVLIYLLVEVSHLPQDYFSSVQI